MKDNIKDIEDINIKINEKNNLSNDEINKYKNKIVKDSILSNKFKLEITNKFSDSEILNIILSDIQKFDILLKSYENDGVLEFKKIDFNKPVNNFKISTTSAIHNFAEIGLNKYEKNFISKLYHQLTSQLQFDKDNKNKVYHVISDEDMRKERLKRIKDIRRTEIQGVIHIDNDGNLHDSIGAVIYDNRLIYKLHNNPTEYIKIVLNKTKFFHRDGNIEEILVCDENLPYTIKYPIKFNDDIRSILINVGHAINMLCREWMTREILAYTKSSQKIIMITAIISIILGIGIGLIL